MSLVVFTVDPYLVADNCRHSGPSPLHATATGFDGDYSLSMAEVICCSASLAQGRTWHVVLRVAFDERKL